MTQRVCRLASSGGFTLIEILAAVVLLSAVATVVIPLTMQAGQRAERLDAAQEAQGVLADALRIGPPSEGIRLGLAHDWWLEVVPMHLQPKGASAMPSHRWSVVRVCRGTAVDHEVLAQQYIAQPRQDP